MKLKLLFVFAHCSPLFFPSSCPWKEEQDFKKKNKQKTDKKNKIK